MTIEIKKLSSHIPPGIISCATSGLPPHPWENTSSDKAVGTYFTRVGAFLGAYSLSNRPLDLFLYPSSATCILSWGNQS